MEQWIRNNFQIIIGGLDDKTECFKFASGGKTVETPIAWFISTFGPNAPTTSNELKDKDSDNSMGWYIHFDAWKAQGILS